RGLTSWPRDGGVAGRIGDARFLEALAAQGAGVAAAACRAVLGVVAGVGHRVVDAEPAAERDDLRLGQLDQRRVDAKSAAAGGDLGERLERGDELPPAVRIAAGVEHVDAE